VTDTHAIDTAFTFLNNWFDPADWIHVEPMVPVPPEPGKEPRSRPVRQLRDYLRLSVPVGKQLITATPEVAAEILGSHLRRVEKAGAHAYFGVCPRVGDKRQYDMAHSIRIVPGYWADFDKTTPEKVLAAIAAAGVPAPTFVIRSGGGVHTYWKFDKRYEITDAGEPVPVLYERAPGDKYESAYVNENGEKRWLRKNRIPLSPQAQMVTDTNKGLYKLITGQEVKADAVQNLNRFLRLVGSKNPKYDPPRMVEIFEFNPANLYPFDLFDKLTVDTRSKVSVAINAVPPPKKRDTLLKKISSKVTDCKIDLEFIPEGVSRSEKCFELVALLYEGGFDQERAWTECAPLSKFVGNRRFFDTTWDAVVKKHATDIVERRQKIVAERYNREGLGPRPVVGESPQQQEFSSAQEAQKRQRAADFCRRVQCDVVGERQDGTIVIYSVPLGKTTEIKDIGRIQKARLIQALGPRASTQISDYAEEGSPTFSTPEAREIIALLASDRSLHGENHVGTGIWPVKDKGILTGELALISGSTAAVYTPATNTIFKLESPRYKDISISLEGSVEHPWFVFEELQADLASIAQPAARKHLVDRLNDHFAQWKWSDGATSPGIMAGLVLASFVQTAWVWRPLVAILGPSASGKTILLQQLAGIFGPLTFPATMATEAAVRQGMGNQAKIILSDEFEHNQHRTRLYELFRTASRGDHMIRGSAGHKMQKFGLKHIPWVGSIELGLDREPDRNRFIQLSTERGIGQVTLWTQEQLGNVRRACVACALYSFSRASLMVQALVDANVATGLDRRLVDNYAVPFAIAATAAGASDEEMQAGFTRLLEALTLDAEPETDDKGFLTTIMGLLVDAGQGQKRTVAEILSLDVTAAASLLDALGRQLGIGVIELKHTAGRKRKLAEVPVEERFLFIAGGKLKESNALRFTRWHEQSANEILRRVCEGAVTGRGHVAKSHLRGVYIPMTWVLQEMVDTQ
jgi:energy-coupling factor transporter ATP-binding protein EcfA2